jgi:hypothetical protein
MLTWLVLKEVLGCPVDLGSMQCVMKNPSLSSSVIRVGLYMFGLIKKLKLISWVFVSVSTPESSRAIDWSEGASIFKGRVLRIGFEFEHREGADIFLERGMSMFLFIFVGKMLIEIVALYRFLFFGGVRFGCLFEDTKNEYGYSSH